MAEHQAATAPSAASDEPREWEAVRAAVISALRAAIEHWPDSDVEEVADVALAVCGEEAVNRMAAQLVDETRIKAMDFRNGAGMDLVPSQTIVANWVAVAKTWLDHHGAVNYTETKFAAKDEVSMEVKLAGEFERFAFILQRIGPGKLTPHEARRRAEAEVERLQAEIEALRGQLEAGRG